MPFFPEGQDPLNQAPGGAQGRSPIGSAAPDPFAGPTTPEVAAAAFRISNPIVSVLNSISRSRPDGAPVLDYNPLADGVVGTKYDSNKDRFFGLENPSQTAAVKAKIDQEQSDKQTVAQGGASGTVWGLAAGVADPFMYMPIIGEMSAARTGLSIAANVARSAASGALATGASEAALQASQETRDWKESAGNIASGTLLMGIFGAAHSFLSPAERTEASAALDAARPRAVMDPESGLAQPVGAQATDTRDLTPKDYGLNQVPGVRNVVENVSPNARVYSGSSVEAKRTLADLAETAFRFNQHDEGLPTSLGAAPLESIVRVQQNQLMLATHDILQDAWVKHYYGGEEPGAVRLAAAKEGIGAPTDADRLSYSDFKSATYDALTAGDAHPVPEVQQAAQQLRTQVLDPVKEFAQQTRTADGTPMLSDELSAPAGDQSFAPRQYVRNALTSKYSEMTQRTADWLESEQRIKVGAQQRLEELQRRHDALGEDAEPQRAAIRGQIEKEIKDWRGKTTDEAVSALKAREKAEAGREEGASPLKSANGAVDKAVKVILGNERLNLTRGELEDVSREIIDRIIGSPDGRVPYDAPTGGPRIGPPGQQNAVRGSLRGRDFAMPSAAFPAGVLNKDVEHVMAAHLRTMLPDIHLTARFGDVDMTDAFRRIQDEYSKKITPDMSEKASAKVIADRDADIRDVAAARDRLRGVYGWNPDPTARKLGGIVRDFQNATALSALGTSVINRLGDLGGNAVFRYGLQNVFHDIWTPFFAGLARMSPVTGIAKQQARDMGIGVEGLLGHMRHNLHDVNDAYLPGNRFSRGLAWATDKSMIINGHGPWTDYMKAMTVNVAQGELGRVVKRIASGAGTKKDVQTIADMNIDHAMAARINEQYEAHSFEVKGSKFADTSSWTDKGARQAFEAAMSREANISVVTAGIGDKPLFLSKPLGAMIGQFKSFAAASHEKILVSNLQQRDGRVLQGALTSLAMGVLSYRLYTMASGQAASANPADWIKEGLSRSAMTGWINEGNQLASKFSGGKIDYNRAYGATAPLTRRADNSPLAELLGPTYARAEGLAGIVSHAASGNLTANDIHQGRMAVPLQNLMGLRILFDQVEDGASGFLGMKPRNRAPGASMPPH